MEEIGWVQPFLFDLDMRCVTGYNESCKFGALFEQAQMGEVGRFHSSPCHRSTGFREEAVVNHGCLWVVI